MNPQPKVELNSGGVRTRLSRMSCQKAGSERSPRAVLPSRLSAIVTSSSIAAALCAPLAALR